MNMQYLRDHKKDYSLITKAGLFWVYDKVQMEWVCVREHVPVHTCTHI